ncbi:GTP-binding protein [Kaistia geumhonensis]|uniref:G3E family GTPase n=1 Tax=Kaistia geumhonensis TaxID=410839 RepID=A0ABU0M1F1_9HYPH|nr:GTP-binding protein [Kaistia geumhonensis]MCX5479991.1 GTP-binding protein [Kaistia geumhonensis]MDQ0514781.1 G3E family GTPase [Kaistia geumhonensis]
MSGYERCPVDVLTGFLGAGKTSLLRRLIAVDALRDTAVLVNEFAALPVDDRLVSIAGAPVGLIGEGCICCVSDGNLRAALISLLDARESGAMPPFQRVLIETSGLADPGAILAALAADPMLKPRLRPGRVVTLVDLVHGEATLGDSAEAVAQIVCADAVFFTKRDSAGGLEAARLAATINALNPLATIVPEDVADPFAWPLPGSGDVVRSRALRRFHAVPVEPRHLEIAAGLLTAEAPIEWSHFAAWLSLLLHRHGTAILRMKGEVAIRGDGAVSAVMVQSVRHVVHAPEHLDRAEGTALVVIARGLDPAAIEASFRRHVTGEATSGGQERVAV